MKNIYLTGPRACGKTTIGKALAKKLGREFADTDHHFLMHAGMQISDFVEKYGWDKFRDVEAEVLEKLAERDGQVIALGGGVVLRESNREILKNGLTIYLKAPAQVLAERLSADPAQAQRPSLTGKSIVEEVREVLDEREPIYQGCADVVLDGTLGIDKSVKEALSHLG